MMFALVMFFLSLLAIGGLFWLKYWETARDRELVPRLRRKGDARAEQLKILMIAGRKDLEKLPPLALQAVRLAVHESALAFAGLLGALQTQTHRLADFVSHKRNFERRETRSEFLKKVAEHKNGHNGGPLDPTP